jgi:ABC-type transport system substrate-binding protein
MNVKKGPTADKKVRKAFAHAVNVPEMVKNVVGDVGQPAAACVARRVFGYRDDIKALLPKYDPEMAKELLAEAGWKDTDGDGILDKDGKPLKVTIDSMNHRTPKDREVTEAIQAYLRKIGVDCSMGIQEWALFVAGYKTLAHDMYTYAWRAITGDCDYPFSSLLRAGYRWNGSGYDNPRVQELISLGKSEPDSKKRLDIYYEYQKITLDDGVWVPLFHENVADGTRKAVKGYKSHPNGRPFFYDVYIE